jgi:hypothetical protein
MSRFARVSGTALSVASLATLFIAQGCSVTAGTEAEDRLGTTAEALLFRCPPGTVAEQCGYDIGPTGKLIYSCSCVPAPVTPEAVSVAHDDGGGCILFSDGSVQCWAGNKELENDAGGFEFAPPTYKLSAVALSRAAVSVAAGSEGDSDFACAVLSDHTVWCWGDNNYGELGDGTFQASAAPTEVQTSSAAGLTPLLATQVTAGNGFSCAVTTQGGVSCWGNNFFGDLGNASIPDGAQAARVNCSDVAVPAAPLPTTATSVAAGSDHACAILANGSVYCWGDNGGFGSPDYGYSLLNGPSLGVGTTTEFVPTPAAVLGLPGAATAVRGGYETTCATVGGELYCWGMIGAAAAPASATPVGFGAAPTAFSLGEYDACEIVGGTPECWGTNPATGGYNPAPAPVCPSSVSATSVAVGGESACVVTTGANVICVDTAYASPVTVF